MSRIVTMPASPPYSSMMTAKVSFLFLKSANMSLTVLFGNTNRGSTMKPETGLSPRPASTSTTASRIDTIPTMFSLSTS